MWIKNCYEDLFKQIFFQLRQIKSDGYVPKTYKVKTKDGYTLRVVRVKSRYSFHMPRGVVFMMHCLMCSCGSFVAGGNQSLAYNFVNSGYDVWMGNTRGTRFSQTHNKYTTDDTEYWNYRYDQMKNEQNKHYYYEWKSRFWMAIFIFIYNAMKKIDLNQIWFCNVPKNEDSNTIDTFLDMQYNDFS